MNVEVGVSGEAYHVVGACGTGMSALVQLLLDRGSGVTASDRAYDRGWDLPILTVLQRAGTCFYPQDGTGVLRGPRAVIVSTAIEPENPDVKQARAAGIPVIHRAEALAALSRHREVLAVTGTSGKSTVTGMLGYIAEQAGCDPCVVNGAPVVNWRTANRVGSVRSGTGIWIVEADESDRSLLAFHPRWAVMTTLSADHFDLAETRRLFTRFRRQVSGAVLDGAEDAHVWAGFVPQVTSGGYEFAFDSVRVCVPLPGRHNAANAWLALHAARWLGVAPATAAQALQGFLGIERRLEKVGVAAGITVLDDYAHNPEKIRASWEAAAQIGGRVHALWRPHGYAPVRKLLPDLVDTFCDLLPGGHRLLLLPVYDAGGTADRTCGTAELVGSLCRAGAPAVAVADYAEAEARILDGVRPGDVVLVMGARDPGLPELARRILHRLQA